MDLTERRLSRKTIYEGKILHIYRDDVLLPNGRTSVREVADHPGGVAIVALDENDNVLTVKQYRYVFSRVLEEIPAGKLERGEDPREAAIRELKEETGAASARMTDLGALLVSPGCYGEVLHLFLAKGLKFSEQHLDPDEFLNVERVPFDEMVHRCMNGEIDDAKTVAAVLRAKDSVMETVTTVRENAEDIYADAKAINQQRAQQEADAVIEDASEAE